MSGKTGAVLAALTMLGMTLATPAYAGCWEGRSVDAAKIRDMQTMLMVGSLRCRMVGTDVLPSYNRFVNNNRGALKQINAQLRDHFGGDTGYDRFTTSLANSYGSGSKGIKDCDALRDIANKAAAAKGNSQHLLAIADDAGVNPVEKSRQCRVKVAAR